MEKFYVVPVALGSQYISNGPAAGGSVSTGILDFPTNLQAADTASEVLQDLFWLWTQVFRR